MCFKPLVGFWCVCILSFVFQNTYLFANESIFIDREMKRVFLTRIISEPEGGAVYKLFVDIDKDNNLQALVRINANKEEAVITYETLSQSEVVLARASGRDALILGLSDGFQQDVGGQIYMRYLYNGISMSYRTFSASLRGLPQTEAKWKFISESGRRIHFLRLIERKILGRTIGIEDIVVNRLIPIL
jgi:hypothetical protein